MGEITNRNRPRRRRGIRFRLLISVNAVALVAVGLLIALDYRAEVRGRLAVMRVALEEEAKTLLPALRGLAGRGPEAVQEHIDLVCSRMRDTSSPGHHIAVDWNGISLQARAHGRESPAMLARMRAALAAGGAGSGRIVVGGDSDGEMTVYVSERVSNIVRRARARAWQRAAVLVGLMIAAAFAVNLILVHLVVRPLRSLAGRVRAVGAGNLKERVPDSKTAELSILGREINEMSAALQKAERRREEEMDKAQRIQELLCRVPEEIPGMTLARCYRPATEVAGDYFDLLPLSDRSWLLCIADVIGHGVPAAMGAAILKTLLGAATEKLVDPSRILRFVNERFCRVSLPGDFATMALVRWDPAGSRLEYAGAGHEAGMFRTPEAEVSQYGSTGMVLGLRADAAWETRSVPVPHGAQLLLTTDGVSETRSPDGRLFGAERLAELFAEHGSGPPMDTLRRIEEALDRHRGEGGQTDDLTLLLARFSAAGEPARTVQLLAASARSSAG